MPLPTTKKMISLYPPIPVGFELRISQRPPVFLHSASTCGEDRRQRGRLRPLPRLRVFDDGVFAIVGVFGDQEHFELVG